MTPTVPGCFSSFATLRKAHSELLARLANYDEHELPAFLIPAIQEFTARALKSGEQLYDWETRNDAQTILSFWTGILSENDRTFKPLLLADFRQRVGGKPPYKGLEAFQQEDESVFFGRRELVLSMVEKLKTARLIGVLGLSGSGKSSVVLAGLLPALKQGIIPSSELWQYINPLTPSTSPIAALEAALRINGLRQDPDALLRCLDRDSCQPSVLVVDQFEEVFTVAQNDDERGVFLDLLLKVAGAPNSPHRVVITMRSEFDTYLTKVPLLKKLVEMARFNVPPMSETDLQNAITVPAAVYGVRFEEPLVNRLVTAVLGEPAGLPLLQFALLELWKKKVDNVIAEKAYVDLGGTPQNLLSNAADRVLNGLATREDRDTTRHVFESLVVVGVSSEATRQRRSRLALHALAARDRVDWLLNKWCTAGLLKISPGRVSEEDLFEIVHETLIRNWPSLIQWVSELAVNRKQRLLFAARAKDWDKSKHKAALLTVEEIQESKRYIDKSEEEERFITASENSLRNRKWARWGVALVGVVLLALSIYYLFQAQKANEARQQLQTEFANARASHAEVEKSLAEQDLALVTSPPKVRVQNGLFELPADANWRPAIQGAQARLQEFLKRSPVAQTILMVREPNSGIYKASVSGTGVLVRGNVLLTSSANKAWRTFKLGDTNTRLEIVFQGADGKPIKYTADSDVAPVTRLQNVGRVSLLKLNGDLSSLPNAAILSKNYSYDNKRRVIMLGFLGVPDSVSLPIVEKVFQTHKWGQLWLRFGIVVGQTSDLQVFSHNCTAAQSDAGAPLFDLDTLNLIGMQIGGSTIAVQGLSTSTALRLWSSEDLARFEPKP